MFYSDGTHVPAGAYCAAPVRALLRGAVRGTPVLPGDTATFLHMLAVPEIERQRWSSTASEDQCHKASQESSV